MCAEIDLGLSMLSIYDILRYEQSLTWICEYGHCDTPIWYQCGSFGIDVHKHHFTLQWIGKNNEYILFPTNVIFWHAYVYVTCLMAVSCWINCVELICSCLPATIMLIFGPRRLINSNQGMQIYERHNDTMFQSIHVVCAAHITGDWEVFGMWPCKKTRLQSIEPLDCW